MKDDAPLARHVSPPLDDARLARQFAAISERAPQLRRRRRIALFAMASVAAMSVALAVWTMRRPMRTDLASLEGTRFGAEAGQSTMMLPDGSRATLDPDARLSVAIARHDLTRLVLESGGVELDVTRLDGRRFVVAAADYEVSVHGTQFSVRFAIHDGIRALNVSVRSGEVHVARTGGAESVLHGGETWSADIDGERTPPASSESTAAPETSAPPLASAPAPSATAAAPSAKDLLARAEEARAADHPAEAARAFDALRKRHRKDPRAALAAFELGRLRLDALKDPSGAAEAFADAIALAPEAPFREDAEARRVEALESVDRARCAEARDAYLARYPQGLHRRAVAARCGSR